MRFAEPYLHVIDVAGNENNIPDAERLLFLELTQSECDLFFAMIEDE